MAVSTVATAATEDPAVAAAAQQRDDAGSADSVDDGAAVTAWQPVVPSAAAAAAAAVSPRRPMVDVTQAQRTLALTFVDLLDTARGVLARAEKRLFNMGKKLDIAAAALAKVQRGAVVARHQHEYVRAKAA